MNTMQVAEGLVTLCSQGKFIEAGETYWDEDVLSVEPFTGEMAVLRGKAAVRAKGEWWVGAHEVHAVEVQAPYVNGDQFMVRYIMDLTVRQTGQRSKLDEIGLYTVKDGRIVDERFFVRKEYFEHRR